MTRLRFSAVAFAASLMLAAPLAAETAITISDPYARTSSAMAQSGAVFMVIENGGAGDDRLVAASAPVAERVELHTHIEDANGVMRMIEIKDGFAVPAGGSHSLARGGDHVMLMGLSDPLETGSSFPLTLVFEEAGAVTVEVPVDNERQPDHGAHGGHSH